MKTPLRVIACGLALIAVAPSARAQTPPIDDCPAGATLHKSLTPLDHDSMLAAYTATFVGLFHRPPTMQPGSGADDGEYWIGISNHYGQYGDNVCRAGWNLYRERQVGGMPTGPGDGDLPAQFQPSATSSQPIAPPTSPTVDVVALAAQVDSIAKDVLNLAQQVSALNGVPPALVALTARVAALEAKPIPASCTASIKTGFATIPISCALR